MAMKKDVKLLIELIEEDRKKKRTKEESLQTLIDAGILDEKGNHTEPYKLLGEAIKRYSQRNV
jgi:hypothetical protein